MLKCGFIARQLSERWFSRKHLLGVAATALLTTAFWAFFLTGAEPRYNGRSLSQWLTDFNRIPPEQPAVQAEQAVRAIGQKAVPFLLPNIWATEPFRVTRGRLWINKAFRSTFRPRIDLCAPSWRALSILGSTATSALPEIAQHAANGPFSGRAMIALAVLGTNSIPTLIKLCGSTNPGVRVDAAFLLAKTKVGMRGAESFLAISPFSDQPMLAYNIKQGLSDLVPLVENLKHPERNVRIATIEAIGSLPELLKAGSPALQSALNDPEPSVRDTARRFALPEAAPPRP